MVATFLASTPLLTESWRLCSLANRSAPVRFVTELIGDVGYVAFSGVQVSGGSSSSPAAGCGGLVALENSTVGNGLFFPLLGSSNEGEEPLMVHAELLSLFLAAYDSQTFRDQVSSCPYFSS